MKTGSVKSMKSVCMTIAAPRTSGVSLSVTNTIALTTTNPGTNDTKPTYQHVDAGDFTKWFPDIQTIQNDINDAVDTLNVIEKLEIQLASDEVQRVLKIPIAHAAAVEFPRQACASVVIFVKGFVTQVPSALQHDVQIFNAPVSPC
jgi:hypothetical protein